MSSSLLCCVWQCPTLCGFVTHTQKDSSVTQLDLGWLSTMILCFKRICISSLIMKKSAKGISWVFQYCSVTGHLVYLWAVEGWSSLRCHCVEQACSNLLYVWLSLLSHNACCSFFQAHSHLWWLQRCFKGNAGKMDSGVTSNTLENEHYS